MCWAGGGHTVLHHHGVTGLEIIAQGAQQGQGPCNLEVWTGRSQPLAIPAHDFFQELWEQAVEGSQMLITEPPC